VTTATDTVTAWSRNHPGTVLLAVGQSADEVTVTIVGATRPPIDDLRQALSTALPQLTVTVQWVAGSVLGRTVPTVPTTSPPPAPGSTEDPTPAPTSS
jgi:hypothetical protein